jgi:hypothetical protein
VLHDAHVLATQPSPGSAFVLRPIAASAPRSAAPVPRRAARRRGAAMGVAGETRLFRVRHRRRTRRRAPSRGPRERIPGARASRVTVTSSTGPGQGDIFTGQPHRPASGWQVAGKWTAGKWTA